MLSSIDSFKLAVYLHHIIKNSIPEARSYVKNTFHLIKKLGSYFKLNLKLASLLYRYSLMFQLN